MDNAHASFWRKQPRLSALELDDDFDPKVLEDDVAAMLERLRTPTFRCDDEGEFSHWLGLGEEVPVGYREGMVTSDGDDDASSLDGGSDVSDRNDCSRSGGTTGAGAGAGALARTAEVVAATHPLKVHGHIPTPVA
eukprot:PhM_4_TR16994/c0_g2_i1/m.97428